MTTLTLDSGIIQLLSESAEWRLLGLLFQYPDAAWRSQLTALLPSLPAPELRQMAKAALERYSEGLHSALFAPSGTVPVREVHYRGGVQCGYLMAELAAFYEAFGYHPHIQDADDHLAVQLGFLAYLKLKQAHALLAEKPENAQVTAEAAEAFLKEHVAVQAEAVLRALENFAPQFLIDAGTLVLSKAGSAPSSSYPLTGLPRDEEGDEDMDGCGTPASGDQLIQLQP